MLSSIYTLSLFADTSFTPPLLAPVKLPIPPIFPLLVVRTQQQAFPPLPRLVVLEPCHPGQALFSSQARTGLYVSKTPSKASLWTGPYLVVQDTRCWT